jgi:hypothetical protein
VVLALTGAFTLVGTLAAIFVGLYALAVIRRHPGQLTGSRLALGGIAAGVLLTLATLAALARPDVLPLGGWLRQRSLAGQVDTTGTLQMTTRSGMVLIDRPSDEWGRARNDRTDDPAVGSIQQKLDLLLVNVHRHAYVDVIRDTTNNNKKMWHEYEEVVCEGINPVLPPLLRDEDSRRWDQTSAKGVFRPDLLAGSRTLEDVGSYNVSEWQFRQRRGKTWWFLIRVFKKAKPVRGDPVFIIRAYTPRARQKDNEEELRRILDSVRIP